MCVVGEEEGKRAKWVYGGGRNIVGALWRGSRKERVCVWRRADV